MTGIARDSSRRSRRRRLCIARGATVLGIGVAAIASCQRFREGTETMRVLPTAEFAELDACLDRGGAWAMDMRACLEPWDDETRDATGTQPPVGLRGR